MTTSTKRRLAIEAEFDEPLEDVIRGFAGMGYTRAETSRTLDLDLDQTGDVLRWIERREGWAIPWPARSAWNARVKTGETMPMTAWAARLGIDRTTLGRRLARWTLIEALSLG